MLTGAIVAAPVVAPVDRKFVVTCCCFGAATLVIAGGFVVVCCVEVDDTAEVGGVADSIDGDGFTVFGIPHICDSVVLTTLRLGLLGSHILAFSSSDIVVVVLSELLLLLPMA